MVTSTRLATIAIVGVALLVVGSADVWADIPAPPIKRLTDQQARRPGRWRLNNRTRPQAHVDRRLGPGEDKSHSGSQRRHMADEEHVALLKQGVKVWNGWRKAAFLFEAYPSSPDLSGANLTDAKLITALGDADSYRFESKMS